MRVLLTSSSFPRHAEDWQSRFIALMVASLARRSDTDLSLWAPKGPVSPEATLVATDSDLRWLSRLSAEGGIAHLLRSNKPLAVVRAAGLLRRLRRTYRDSDAEVVHANWLQNALPLWGTRTPALISVLGSDFGLLRLPGMRTALRAMLRQREATLAPNAEWMVPALQDYFGDIASVQAIPFGVDPMWLDLKRQALPRPRWIAVTRLTRAKVGDLFTWGEGCFGPQRELHLYGPMQEDIAIPPWVIFHGPTHPSALAQAFAKASGLITLSRHDEGRPQVMLEAMAASLPVVASDIAAHQSIVHHGVTGWLVREPADVAQGLAYLEDPLQNDRAGVAARQWAVDNVGTWDDCAARYVNAYRKLLRTA